MRILGEMVCLEMILECTFDCFILLCGGCLQAVRAETIAPMSAETLSSIEQLEDVPEPMFTGNAASESRMCIMNDVLRCVQPPCQLELVSHSSLQWKLLDPVVYLCSLYAGLWRPCRSSALANASHGFEWWDGDKGAWAWWSNGTEAGATLTLRFSTLKASALSVDPAPPNITVALGYLRSGTRKMGQARASCIGGCMCDSFELHGHWRSQTTQPHLQAFLATGHPECRLQIVVRLEVLSQVMSTSQEATMCVYRGWTENLALLLSISVMAKIALVLEPVHDETVTTCHASSLLQSAPGLCRL